MTYKRKQYEIKHKRNPYARDLLRPLSPFRQRVVRGKNKIEKITKSKILEELNYEGESYEES